MPRRGSGNGIKFLRALLTDAPADCVIWPQFRDENGYGRLVHEQKQYWAHRLMCEMAHGAPPSPDHEAAHSCGRGHEGCVNPRHLSWATKTRNQLDRRSHGTKSPCGWRWRPKLTPEQVLQIRALKGTTTQTQREIAGMFGVTDATVRDVWSGKSWKNLVVKRTSS